MKIFSILLIFILLCPLKAWSCNFNATLVNFAEYNPISESEKQSSGSIRVSGCLLTIVPTIKFSKGNSPTYERYMSKLDNSDKLNYNLYLNSARTQVWGDGTEGTSFYNVLLTIPIVGYNIPVYAVIPKRQNVAAGSYSDLIHVNITF